MIDKLVLSALPFVPRPLMRRLASRYIAGETLEEALAAMQALARAGTPSILDILGENVASAEEARGAARAYAEGAERIAAARLDAYVSVKPTHLGLRIDEAACRTLFEDLAARCRRLGLRVRVEMEDHPTTDATLRLFEALRERYENVGIVLQSRLFRTPADIARLAPGPLDVRIVKGIYLEPASIAHTEPGPIREAFVECTRALLARGARVRLATHDEALGDRCAALVRESGRPAEEVELQVLLGVREDVWTRWRARGWSVRVYVPFGPDWRAYSLRRLRKNPQILRHVMRDAFRLGARAR